MSTSSTNSGGRPIGSAPHSPFWIHFLSGGIAGTIGAVVTCPLELVKTRFQSSHFQAQRVVWSFQSHPAKFVHSHVSGVLSALQNIYKTEGPRALWKGVGATVVGVMPSRAIYFSTYQTCKSHLTNSFFDGKETSLVHLCSAVAAGMVTATATNPIWLVKTRIQLQPTGPGAGHPAPLYAGSLDCLRKLVRREGFFSLYQGLSASYLGCIEGTLQWVLYERIKQKLTGWRQAEGKAAPPRSWEDTFIAAAVSKFVSCTLTYPHEVLRTRMRQGTSPAAAAAKSYSGLIRTARRIYYEEGVAAFYGGMTAHLLRVVPNSAIMFFCYELLVYSMSLQFAHPPPSSVSSASSFK